MLTPSTAEVGEGLPSERSLSDEEARAERLRGLVRSHFAVAWKFLRRLGFKRDVVDDATQELFLVARRRLDEVTPGRERAFLFGAAIRIATHINRKRVREVPAGHLRAEIDDSEAVPEQRLDDEKARALLYRLLGELDEHHRVVFVMYELEQMTMSQIAEALGIPLGTVASRLRRGRADFHARLERHRARAAERRGT